MHSNVCGFDGRVLLGVPFTVIDTYPNVHVWVRYPNQEYPETGPVKSQRGWGRVFFDSDEWVL